MTTASPAGADRFVGAPTEDAFTLAAAGWTRKTNGDPRAGHHDWSLDRYVDTETSYAPARRRCAPPTR